MPTLRGAGCCAAGAVCSIALGSAPGLGPESDVGGDAEVAAPTALRLEQCRG
jgi:hypothetical protein